MRKARATPRCSYYFQDNHRSTACPRNPDKHGSNTNSPMVTTLHPLPPYSQHRMVPRKSVAGLIREYVKQQGAVLHIYMCKECSGPHPALACPQLQGFHDCSPQIPTPKTNPLNCSFPIYSSVGSLLFMQQVMSLIPDVVTFFFAL